MRSSAESGSSEHGRILVFVLAGAAALLLVTSACDILKNINMNVCCQPLAASSLTDAEADATANLFRALADPARVKIVNLLARTTEPVCACEFEPALDLSQPTVSHHLKKLTDAGLVAREQRGKWAYFSLSSDAVETLAFVADLRGACC